METDIITYSRKGCPNQFKNTGVIPEAYKRYRKSDAEGQQKLTKQQFHDIVLACNTWIIAQILKGLVVPLPCALGSLEIVKTPCKRKRDNRINWLETKRLWMEDEECRRNKTLVRFEEEYIYEVLYLSKGSKLKHRKNHYFMTSRLLKRQIKKQINKGRTYGLTTKKY